MHDGFMMGMGWSWLLGILLLLAVIWAVVRIGSRAGGDDRAAPRGRDPGEVLRDRLARGEIDEDEYRSRMDTLREGR